MEIPTDYTSFKQKGMKLRSQLKEAFCDKDWGWLTTFVVTALFVLVPAGGYVIGGVDAGISVLTKYISLLRTPDFAPKELTYRLIERGKTQEDLHRTLFEITIYNPAGNTDPFAVMSTNFGQLAECDKGSEVLYSEIGPGVATSTQQFLLECRTKEPMIDDGGVFSLIQPE